MVPVVWKSLPLRFIYSGLFYLIIASAIGLLNLAGYSLKPVHSHLMLAGFVSLVIIGSMYQLVPTVTGTELKLKNLAELSFYLTNLGVLLLIASFFGMIPFYISGPAYLLGTLAFGMVVFVTLTDMKLKSIAVPFFGLAIALYMAGTVYGILGMSGKIPFRISVHNHLLTAGWVGVTTFGGLYELFPMLSLRKLRSVTLAYITFIILLVSLPIMLYGFQNSASAMVTYGGAGYALAFLLLSANLMLTLARESETPAPLDISVKFFVPALLFGMAGVFAGLLNADSFTHSHLMLVGWITLTIIGAAYHIIPMITWMEKYSMKLGAEDVPMIADLFNLKLGEVILVLSVLGTVLLLVPGTRMVGGILLFGAFLAFTYDMIMVQRR